MFFEKATKFEINFPMIFDACTTTTIFKKMWKIFSGFVAYSEAIKFKLQFTVIKVGAVLQNSSGASQSLACLPELSLSLILELGIFSFNIETLIKTSEIFVSVTLSPLSKRIGRAL